MRHRVQSKRLGRQTGHRNALLKNLVTNLLVHGKITTTETKAKEAAKLAGKLITLARKGDLASRREVLRYIADREVVKRLFEVIAHQYSSRQPGDPGSAGGCTRTVKLGLRKGDGAPVVLLELV